MTDEDTKAKWAALRKSFPAGMIGKLPRVTCKPCRDVRNGACASHQRKWCDVCKNTITTAHMHLDYAGHAAVTDRIQSVDPEWTWTFAAVDEHGLPIFDRNNGLWIFITILDVTRPAYGDAEGKSGGDAIKAAISDAIKNGAMRFGVGLDLWSKEDLAPAEMPPVEVPAVAPPAPDNTTDETIDWLAVPASVDNLEALTAKASECNTAGAFKGAVQTAFRRRKKQLEDAATAAAAGQEERALKLVKDELGAQEVAS